jgi:putative phage-type endonuclease
VSDRSTYIGGSDIAAILGISPWRTSWDVWAEKTRDPSWQPQAETDAMRWGTLLEPLLAAEYERTTGRRVVLPQDAVVDLNRPYLRGHLDGWSVGSPSPRDDGIWEGKTAGNPKDWTDPETKQNRVPEYYEAQCYFYLALTGAPWCDVSVLLPHGDFRTIRLMADERLQRGIIAKVDAFYAAHVLTRIPPPMDASPAASRWLARIADSEEDALEAGAELESVIERLSGVRASLKALESTDDLLTNQAKALVGEHQRAIGRGWSATYKRTKPFDTVDWKQAAGEMGTMLQLAGLDPSDAIKSATTHVENRRPFVLKVKETE